MNDPTETAKEVFSLGEERERRPTEIPVAVDTARRSLLPITTQYGHCLIEGACGSYYRLDGATLKHVAKNPLATAQAKVQCDIYR